ncbi:uncharacterized protein LOC128193478 [Vigna angularis]|uniref:uncharacterized protein LOC128193478 n=1 Tax=Phaseolus angularis TaxID=3914 RepID=UPI0022B2DE92|nr:uncharacterized protein LOC128193478 [Vigna angularis]
METLINYTPLFLKIYLLNILFMVILRANIIMDLFMEYLSREEVEQFDMLSRANEHDDNMDMYNNSSMVLPDFLDPCNDQELMKALEPFMKTDSSITYASLSSPNFFSIYDQKPLN